MQAFQRDLEKFRATDTEIIGISGDSIETHRKFAKKYGLDFPLVSDGNRTIAAQYGSGRITFLIDKKGLVRHIEKGVPDNKRILTEIGKLKD